MMGYPRLSFPMGCGGVVGERLGIESSLKKG